MQEKTQGVKKPCAFCESRIPQPYAGNNRSQFCFRCRFPGHLQTDRKLHMTVITSGTSQLPIAWKAYSHWKNKKCVGNIQMVSVQMLNKSKLVTVMGRDTKHYLAVILYIVLK